MQHYKKNSYDNNNLLKKRGRAAYYRELFSKEKCNSFYPEQADFLYAHKAGGNLPDTRIQYPQS